MALCAWCLLLALCSWLANPRCSLCAHGLHCVLVLVHGLHRAPGSQILVVHFGSWLALCISTSTWFHRAPGLQSRFLLALCPGSQILVVHFVLMACIVFMACKSSLLTLCSWHSLGSRWIPPERRPKRGSGVSWRVPRLIHCKRLRHCSEPARTKAGRSFYRTLAVPGSLPLCAGAALGLGLPILRHHPGQ